MNNKKQCIVCGAETLEDDHLCNICKTMVKTKVTTDTETDIREAAAKIKDFCLSRIHKQKNACSTCPIKDICFNEPYLWEV